MLRTVIFSSCIMLFLLSSCTKNEAEIDSLNGDLQQNEELRHLTSEEFFKLRSEMDAKEESNESDDKELKARCRNGTRIQFFEGFNQTQDDLSCVNIDTWRTAQFHNFKRCTGQLNFDNSISNDEAKSARIFFAQAGERYLIFDSNCGRQTDDWVEILVLRGFARQDIDRFESTWSNNNVSVIYHREDGKLEGKVSAFRWESSRI